MIALETAGCRRRWTGSTGGSDRSVAGMGWQKVRRNSTIASTESRIRVGLTDFFPASRVRKGGSSSSESLSMKVVSEGSNESTSWF